VSRRCHGWLATLALVAGCGRVGFVARPLDAGPGFDAGPDYDAGPGFDAGPDYDAGPDHDGGPGFDAGPDYDAGPPRDAGPTGPTVSGGGFALVRAWGAAPNAPAGSPRVDTVELTWEPRRLPPGGAYAVVRDLGGVAPDVTATATCTSTSPGPCRACFGTTTDCIDASVAASPARYRYAVVVLTSAGLVMADPEDPRYVVDVPVPPANMVLAHRASVNREMCDLLGSVTDPDALHRCPYTGPGAVPLRAHPESPDLGLSSGFYDFGYDLFVDRWEAACNWTHARDGGLCAVGATAGDCVGTSPPGGSGVPGNVFYSPYNGRCWVRTAAAWIEVHNLASSGAAGLGAAYTNDPGAAHDRPPLGWVSARQAAAVCATSTVPVYGAKRTWRMRELVAVAAFERLVPPARASPWSRMISL